MRRINTLLLVVLSVFFCLVSCNSDDNNDVLTAPYIRFVRPDITVANTTNPTAVIKNDGRIEIKFSSDVFTFLVTFSYNGEGTYTDSLYFVHSDTGVPIYFSGYSGSGYVTISEVNMDDLTITGTFELSGGYSYSVYPNLTLKQGEFVQVPLIIE